MNRKTLAATASAIFAAGIVTTAQAQTAGGVKCVGINSCKGQGWTVTTDVISCTTRGGKVEQQ